jgi:hypothetical protein
VVQCPRTDTHLNHTPRARPGSGQPNPVTADSRERACVITRCRSVVAGDLRGAATEMLTASRRLASLGVHNRGVEGGSVGRSGGFRRVPSRRRVARARDARVTSPDLTMICQYSRLVDAKYARDRIDPYVSTATIMAGPSGVTRTRQGGPATSEGSPHTLRMALKTRDHLLGRPETSSPITKRYDTLALCASLGA